MKFLFNVYLYDTIRDTQTESQEVLRELENLKGCMESWRYTLVSLYRCSREPLEVDGGNAKA